MKKYEQTIIIALSMIVLSSCTLIQNSKKNSTQSISEPSKSYAEISKRTDSSNERGSGTNVEPIIYKNGYGNRSGYSLINRKALSKPTLKYTCNEVGIVVVEVSVDRNGNTINAIAGIKGSTNTAKCLLNQARIAAMNTKWDASSDAPEKQVGKIVYNFNLN